MKMADDEFKSEARCKYHRECTLYNHGALSGETENLLCGIGSPLDQDYQPEFPNNLSDFMPANGYAFAESGGGCDAYLRYEYAELVKCVIEHTNSIETLFKKHLIKHKHW